MGFFIAPPRGIRLCKTHSFRGKPAIHRFRSLSAGCANKGGKKRSSVRLYEGDTSPHIRMYDEKPGYPLNPL